MTSVVLPSGFPIKTMNKEIENFGKRIKNKLGVFDQCWISVGSGTLVRGLQISNIAHEFYAVLVTGEFLEKKKKSISKQYIGSNIILINVDIKFNERINYKNAPPYPSATYYDAKVWKYAKSEALKMPDKKFLIWNVM